MRYDLHIHTIYSDGKATPLDVIEIAKNLEIGVAITDHNHIKGSIIGKNLAINSNIPFICGMELGTREGKELLIYFDDPYDAEEFYIKEVEPFRTSRMTRIARPITDFIGEAGKEKRLRYSYKFTTLPHPFGPLYKNIYSDLTLTRSLLKAADCIEAINATQSAKNNAMSLSLAIKTKKFATASTDAHLLKVIGKVTTDIEFKDEKLAHTDISHNAYLDNLITVSTTLFQISVCNIKHSFFKKGDSLV